SQPVDLVNAGDGSGRLFVVEQAGQIRIVQGGTVQNTPFLDIRDRVLNNGEQGLLSLAFPSDYAAKRRFYVYYTNPSGNLVLSRFQLQANSEVGDPATEQVLFSVPHPTYTNHNGGKLAFGPDGYLYVGLGDGGGSGDPLGNAQNPATLLGKLLRLDVESPGVTTYAIPSNNPFTAANDPSDRVRDEIWASGLRNPWRISFDRQTGDLYIADVGERAREEVNLQPVTSRGGENYGWNISEGTLPFSSGDSTGFTLPLVEYDHSQGRSITGGYVYRGAEYAGLQGAYVYGDFITGRIWGVRRTQTGVENKLLLDSPYNLSTFGEDQQGNLYAVDFRGGIYRITVPT
ncbi:PQQ-dependent sugar dehydrogenase, partial [Leptolyngbya sp. FACHB-36]|uniref:PQQ-dependent sugar dehydrogenase n=1 Tax=Leptolyngbya sp. FACHB-36 TaxID=2692808 RepID=UPI0016812710